MNTVQNLTFIHAFGKIVPFDAIFTRTFDEITDIKIELEVASIFFKRIIHDISSLPVVVRTLTQRLEFGSCIWLQIVYL